MFEELLVPFKPARKDTFLDGLSEKVKGDLFEIRRRHRSGECNWPISALYQFIVEKIHPGVSVTTCRRFLLDDGTHFPEETARGTKAQEPARRVGKSTAVRGRKKGS